MLETIGNFLVQYENIIHTLCSIFTAVGTVGAIIVALWLSRKENKPKLRVNAYTGTTLPVSPDNEDFLWVRCVNVGKPKIICTGIDITPNRFTTHRFAPNWLKRKAFRAALMQPDPCGSSLPAHLFFGEKANVYFNKGIFKEKQFSQFSKAYLSKYRWIAKIQLNFFWRVIVRTNISEFSGSLPKLITDQIIEHNFCKDT